MNDLTQEEVSERFPVPAAEPTQNELAAANEEQSIALLPPDAEISGDYIVSLETGEVYGFASKPEFAEIKTDEDAYWVLNRLNQAESRALAARVREEAILENCKKMRAVEDGIVKWLRTVYETQLTEWAKTQLVGKKAKSVNTPFGKVGFRAVGGGIKAVDPNLAERWASEYDPDAVKVVREFQISKISDATKELIQRVHRGEHILKEELEAANGIRAAFHVAEPVDKGYVDTGVKLK